MKKKHTHTKTEKIKHKNIFIALLLIKFPIN